jgi:hypothetical protein
MTQFSDIIVTPTYGPISTNQYPYAAPSHNSGVLPGKSPNPPLFYPSQEPVAADQNTNSRHQYFRTAESAASLAIQRARAVEKTYRNFSFNYSTGTAHHTSGHTNYINPMDSSLRTQKLRSNAVGKSGYKVGLPLAAPYSTKNYYPSGVRSTIKRARSGGCTAPAKKGSIFNDSLRNGQTCAWGSLVRQNY